MEVCRVCAFLISNSTLHTDDADKFDCILNKYQTIGITQWVWCPCCRLVHRKARWLVWQSARRYPLSRVVLETWGISNVAGIRSLLLLLWEINIFWHTRSYSVKRGVRHTHGLTKLSTDYLGAYLRWHSRRCWDCVRWPYGAGVQDTRHQPRKGGFTVKTVWIEFTADQLIEDGKAAENRIKNYHCYPCDTAAQRISSCDPRFYWKGTTKNWASWFLCFLVPIMVRTGSVHTRWNPLSSRYCLLLVRRRG